MATPATLTITVHRLLHRLVSGWCVLDTDRGACKGVVPWAPVAGQRLALSGVQEVFDAYTQKTGYTFKAAQLAIEADPRSLLHYAVSITKGLGPATEEEIWSAYGTDWQHDPDADMGARPLDRISGLSEGTRTAWTLTLDRITSEVALTSTMAWLLAHGCTDLMAQKAWDKWGPKATILISGNPYLLCELARVAFVDVDERVARSLGIEGDDPRRADAAFFHALNQLADRGGETCLTLSSVRLAAAKLHVTVTPEFIAQLVRDRRLMLWPAANERDLDHIADARDYQHEQAIWTRFGGAQADTLTLPTSTPRAG